MRRANVGDEQVCVDTLTLSRRPLPPDSEKPLNVEIGDVDRHLKKLNADVHKRAGSPYDNLLSTGDDLPPQYGFLAQPSSAQGSDILPSYTEGLLVETQLPEPFVSEFNTFRQQPRVPRQVVKSPLSNVAAVLQHRSPEPAPPIYSEAKDMPSAQLQNISYSHYDDVDALAAILKNVDPHAMENAAHRRQIMSQLENYPSSSSGAETADLSSKFDGRRVQTNPADTGSDQTGWHCQKCTFYNEKTTMLCDMCQSKKV